jgi:hypothetical protein
MISEMPARRIEAKDAKPVHPSNALMRILNLFYCRHILEFSFLMTVYKLIGQQRYIIRPRDQDVQ